MYKQLRAGAAIAALVLSSALIAAAQAASAPRGVPVDPAVKVKQISEADLAAVIKPQGRPMLINFWATWCVPCREEFPDLVAIDSEYNGKIDFITISLDDLAEINRDVPKFLHSMKAEMPAYLLHTPDQDQAIAMISKEWRGGLPYTILFGADGKPAYSRQGKVIMTILRRELDKAVQSAAERPGTQE